MSQIDSPYLFIRGFLCPFFLYSMTFQDVIFIKAGSQKYAQKYILDIHFKIRISLKNHEYVHIRQEGKSFEISGLE